MLFCKPTNHFLFKCNDAGIGAFSWRPLDLSTDLSMICHWAGQEDARRFWQLAGTKEQVYRTYAAILENPAGHSFIGLLDGVPVCQVDLYQVGADELGSHLDAGPDDCGMHLLMAPPVVPCHGLTLAVLQTFLQYYFSFPQAQVMYAEPDADNTKANALLQKAGFRFLRTIAMSYKTANLYCFTR